MRKMDAKSKHFFIDFSSSFLGRHFWPGAQFSRDAMAARSGGLSGAMLSYAFSIKRTRDMAMHQAFCSDSAPVKAPSVLFFSGYPNFWRFVVQAKYMFFFWARRLRSALRPIMLRVRSLSAALGVASHRLIGTMDSPLGRDLLSRWWHATRCLGSSIFGC